MATLIPPSAMTLDPNRKLAFSDARKAMTSAISAGRAARLVGSLGTVFRQELRGHRLRSKPLDASNRPGE